MPLKHLVYRNLFEIFDLFLLREFGVTPSGNPMWFYFGSVRILGSGAFGNYGKFQIESTIRSSRLESRENQGYTGVRPCLEVKESLERILNTSARVLGPELTTHLVSFNNSVSIFVQAAFFEAHPDYQSLRQVWFDIGMDAFKIRLYLEKAADQVFTPQEDLNNLIHNFKRSGPARRG